MRLTSQLLSYWLVVYSPKDKRCSLAPFVSPATCGVNTQYSDNSQVLPADVVETVVVVVVLAAVAVVANGVKRNR